MWCSECVMRCCRARPQQQARKLRVSPRPSNGEEHRSLTRIIVLAQGTYLAPLTQLTRLCTMFERLPTAAERLSAANRLLVRLDEYPLSLQVLDFVLADTVRLTVESYHDANSDIKTIFRAKEGSRNTSLVLTDAARRLCGAAVDCSVHSLEVQIEEVSDDTDLDCPASCLMEWVAQSRAQSVTLRTPPGGSVGTTLVKASVADLAEELGVREFHARLSQMTVDLIRLCARFGLTCVFETRAVVLRNMKNTSS